MRFLAFFSPLVSLAALISAAVLSVARSAAPIAAWSHPLMHEGLPPWPGIDRRELVPAPVRAALIALVSTMLLFFLLLLPALAQATPLPGPEGVGATSATTDIGLFARAGLEFVTPIVIAVVGTVGTWVLARVARLVGLQQDSWHRATVEQGLERAVGYAMSRLGDRAAGGIPIGMRGQAINMIAAYAAKHFPDALKHFRKTGEDVAAMAEARLEIVLVDPEVERQSAVARPLRAAGAIV